MRLIRTTTAAALVAAASLACASASADGKPAAASTVHKATPRAQGTDPQDRGAANGMRLKPIDRGFLVEAFDHASEDLAIGELASRQGQSDQVKKAGAQIVTDETAALQKLRDIAQKNGLTLPQAPPQQDMAYVGTLSKLQGKQFDEVFLAQIRGRDGHALASFEQESKSGADGALKSYASDQLPVIRGQLDQLKTGVTSAQKK